MRGDKLDECLDQEAYKEVCDRRETGGNGSNMGFSAALPKVSVLILNYNGAKFIEACLDSILAQSYPIHEIIVIDNASTDNSIALAKTGRPGVAIVEAGANLGFAGGMNLGIRKSNGEFLLLLNPDVVLDEEFLKMAVEAIQTDSRTGSVSGKVLKMAEKEAGRLDTTGHVIFRNRLFTDRGDGEADIGQYDEVEEIFGACAGAGLYRREMLEDIRIADEYFDESFFLFLEDTDLNWRAQLRGWKCVYEPRAVARHWRGGVAERKTKLVELHNYKNRYMMIIKNDSFWSVAKNFHHFLLTDTIKTAALLWRCPAALGGIADVWRNLPALMRKRRIIQSRRTISQKDFERWLMPVDYAEWVRRHFKKTYG